MTEPNPVTTQRRVIADALVDKPMSTTSRPATGTDTVVIACKIAGGIVIRGFEWEDFDEPNPSGVTRRIKRAVEVGRFVIKGPNSTLAPMSPAGRFPLLVNSGGYAMTPGVPRELWEQWVATNRDSPIVKNRLIFAANSEDRALDEGRELQKQLSGLEPIDTSSAQTIRARMGRDRLSVATMDRQD